MFKIGIIGFGTVGTGVYERLEQSKELLKRQLGADFEVRAILVKDRQKSRAEVATTLVTTEWKTFLQASSYDLIFEAIGGIEPAYTYSTTFLKQGIPVVTANKKLVAERGEALELAAAENGTYYGYEAAVAGGIPIINALKGTLASTSISRIAGILNGTTNYMLTEMLEYQRGFAEVLKEAQELGYAETDPTDDIEGYDAWYKIRILSRLCFGKWPEKDDFVRQGLSNLEDWHVELGQRIGLRLKLIGESQLDSNGEVKGFVAPAFLTKEQPLANVSGVLNGISVEGDKVGQLLFIGPGAGKEATANSMVEDFLFHERYKGERLGVYSRKKEQPIEHILLFIHQSQREHALSWVKDEEIPVLNTYSHQSGEAWLLLASKPFDIPYPFYRVYGKVHEPSEQQTTELTQFGPVYL